MSRWRTKDDSVTTIELDRSDGVRDEEEPEPLWRRTISIAFTVAVIAFTVFLWPRTNLGAIKKASGDLIATQAKRFRAGCNAMAGQDAGILVDLADHVTSVTTKRGEDGAADVRRDHRRARHRYAVADG